MGLSVLLKFETDFFELRFLFCSFETLPVKREKKTRGHLRHRISLCNIRNCPEQSKTSLDEVFLHRTSMLVSC